jgi:type II secretory pathway pseudopilin PulG
MTKNNYKQKGFTLIELIVSTALFIVVMIVAIGAVLSAVEADRKAQALNAVINNVTLTFESMIRDLRTGYNYSNDYCSDPTSCINFTDKDGNTVSYALQTDDTGSYIVKTSSNAAESGRITSSEVTLQAVSFIIQGNAAGGGDGPERVLLHIQGYAGNNQTRSNFNVETLITSRTLDVSEFNN